MVKRKTEDEKDAAGSVQISDNNKNMRTVLCPDGLHHVYWRDDDSRMA